MLPSDTWSSPTWAGSGSGSRGCVHTAKIPALAPTLGTDLSADTGDQAESPAALLEGPRAPAWDSDAAASAPVGVTGLLDQTESPNPLPGGGQTRNVCAMAGASLDPLHPMWAPLVKNLEKHPWREKCTHPLARECHCYEFALQRRVLMEVDV